jgi:hypothetical protein
MKASWGVIFLIAFLLCAICITPVAAETNWTYPNASRMYTGVVDLPNSTFMKDWLYFIALNSTPGSVVEFPVIGFAYDVMLPFTSAFTGLGGTSLDGGSLVYLMLWGLYLMMVYRNSGKTTIPAMIAAISAGAWGLLIPQSIWPWCTLLLAAAISAQLLSFIAKE